MRTTQQSFGQQIQAIFVITLLMSAPASAARNILQRRALQCSFSSVFHLKDAGMGRQQANFIENLFLGSVGVPIVILGATGFVCAMTKE